MQKFLEEFGKHILNVGTALIIIVVLQPLMHGKANIKAFVIATIAYLSLIALSLFFFWLSDKFKQQEVTK
jgi:uncharacterized membrane protein (DUF441 family)